MQNTKAEKMCGTMGNTQNEKTVECLDFNFEAQ